MLAAGFTDDFSSQRSPLSSEHPSILSPTDPGLFEALGEVTTLSGYLLDLYHAMSKIDVKPMAVYWRSSFDFESVDPAVAGL